MGPGRPATSPPGLTDNVQQRREEDTAVQSVAPSRLTDGKSPGPSTCRLPLPSLAQ